MSIKTVSVLYADEDDTRRDAFQSQFRSRYAGVYGVERRGGIGAGGPAEHTGHHLKSTLGGIMGFAEMSLDEARPGSVLETYIKYILKAATRAKHLVQQILSFSRKSFSTPDTASRLMTKL